MMEPSSGIPFVELYRPRQFEDIVLDPINKAILQNIIRSSYFPNLLLYGPPGTGKTTTIVNLIHAYQETQGVRNKDLVIHLNASDERGIDIIRNQINHFVNSKPLFNKGMKFVILDEVDYMTKNAQQALRYLLQNYTSKVRFCLICNYISKIDEGLQNEFIRLRFNQLPREDIIAFLGRISEKEQLGLTSETLSCIQQLYKSDVRSMINFMQSNQHLGNQCIRIMGSEVWEELLSKLRKREPLDETLQHLQKLSLEYNVDKRHILKQFLNYLLQTHSEIICHELLSFIENVMHSQNQSSDILLAYALTKVATFI